MQDTNYVIKNSKGQYFSIETSSFAYYWGTGKQRVLFSTAADAEQCLREASSPKTVRSGKTVWERPDYPSIEDAVVVLDTSV